MELYGTSIFDCSLDDVVAFRRSFTNLIHAAKPSWRRIIPIGRTTVFKQLNPDELQCFYVSSLTSTPPDLECVQWWTNVGNEIRAEEESLQESRWRVAEYRSFKMESKMLEGSDYEPIWVSIDDNNAGYDIKSWRFYDPSEYPLTKFIEVKHSSSIARFYISRQEWNFATRHREFWELHFWLQEAEQPKILKFAELENHVAINQGSGRWETMRIEVGKQ